MAKREMSSTLRNLKFMQRGAAHREEPKPKAEGEKKVEIDVSFGASPAPSRKCIVIMEGNPHPGALKGRMSFQSFNPSIDKLREEAAIVRQMQETNINHRNGSSEREDGVSTIGCDSNSVSPNNNSDHKRKQPEMNMATPSSSNSQKIDATGHGSEQTSSSQQNSRGDKQQKRERLDFNVLRPPKRS